MAAAMHLDRLVRWMKDKVIKKEACTQKHPSIAISRKRNNFTGASDEVKSWLRFAVHSASVLSEFQTRSSCEHANDSRNSSVPTEELADCSSSSLRIYNPHVSVSTSLNDSASSSETRVPAPWDAMPINLKDVT
ncbi:hypothetical protein KEM54_001700 [Ascosphaera aggregata]|nr:hypothetical protein KEM54_001700 [Ascosphaera aggregata]